MKIKLKSSAFTGLNLIAVLVALGVFFNHAASAANIIKIDTTTMNTSADWSQSGSPVAPDQTTIGEFDGTLSPANAAGLTLGGDISVLGLLLDGTLQGPITIANGNTLSIYGSGIDMSAANQDLSLSATNALAADQTWNIQSGRMLTVGGSVSGAFNLTKTGGGTLTLNGTNTFGAGKIFELKAGTLNCNNANALGDSNCTFQIDASTTLDNTSGSIKTTAYKNPLIINGDVTYGGTAGLNLGFGTGSGAGTLGTAAGTARTITSSGTAALNIQNALANGTTATSLIKAGTAQLWLSGANSYTGDTVINAGTLVLSGGSISSPAATLNIAVLPATAGAFTLQSGSIATVQTLLATNVTSDALTRYSTFTFGTGTLNTSNYNALAASILAKSNELFAIAGSTSPATLSIWNMNAGTNGIAAAQTNGSWGNLNFGSDSGVNINVNSNAVLNVGNPSWPVTNNVSLRIGQNANASSNVVFIGGPGALVNVCGYAVNLGNGSNANNNTIIITNGGRFARSVAGGGTALSIGNGNSAAYNSLRIYTNSTCDMGNVTLVVGAASFAINNNLTVSGGILTNVGTVNLGGNAGTVTNASNNSFIVTNGGRAYLNNTLNLGNPGGKSGSVGSFVTVGGGTGISVLSLAGVTSLRLNGFNSLSTNAYVTLFTGGVLTNAFIEFGGANPTLNFNGGTLIARTVGGAMISTNNSTVLPVNPNIYVQAGGAMIDDNGVSAVMNALPLQHDPALGGTADGGLIKLGAGTLTLTNGANTYTGPTTVSNGTLLVNSSIASAAVVEPGAALGGLGTINGTVTVNSGGKIRLGASGSTLTFANSTAPAYGTLTTNVIAAAAAALDKISASATTGNSVANLDLVIDTTSLSSNVPSAVIYSAGGAIAGPFHSVTVVGNTGYTPTLDYSTSGQIKLALATAPSSVTTTVQVGSSTNPSAYGQLVTFTATVQTNGVTAAAATGSVQFKTNGVAFGSPVNVSGGVAGSTGVNGWSVLGSPYTVTAEFTGIGNYLNSTNSLSQTVSQATPVLTLSATAITAGQALSNSVLTVSATNANNNAAVGGTYAFATPGAVITYAGTANPSVNFTPTDVADYNGASGTVAVAVNLPTVSTNITLTFGSGALTLSWPANYTGWELQSNAVAVANTNYWFPVLNSTSTNQVTIPVSVRLTNVFYRLHHP